tara:strand:+ start:105 stop:284 length:180 start_codon:yes stop_codon:yes gene_type:complete
VINRLKEEAIDTRQRAAISWIKEEIAARLMEEAGGGRSVAPPFKRLLRDSQRTRSTMLI